MIETMTPPGVEQIQSPRSEAAHAVIETMTPPGVEQHSDPDSARPDIGCDRDDDASGR